MAEVLLGKNDVLVTFARWEFDRVQAIAEPGGLPLDPESRFIKIHCDKETYERFLLPLLTMAKVYATPIYGDGDTSALRDGPTYLGG